MRALLCSFVVVSALANADPADCATRGGKWLSVNGWTGCMVKNVREGEWTHALGGGQLLERSGWASGKRNGPYEKWFESCQIAERGAFENGRKTGAWVVWNEEGRKEREGSYERDRETGVWVEYHRDTGLKHLEGPYVKGYAEGTFTEYLPRGEKWREVKFHEGRRVGEPQRVCDQAGGEWTVDFKGRREGCTVDMVEQGVWFGYDGNGKLRSQGDYVKGRLTGAFKEFHPTGQVLREGQYKSGLPVGTHVFLAPDGSEYGTSTIRNGTGDWKPFHPNGKPAEEGHFEGGCAEGTWRTFSEEGRLTTEETYRDCKRNGPYTWFHSNGQRRLVGQYVDGHADGEWRAFYSNGDPDWVGSYDQGTRTGDWTFWRWGKQLRSKGPMENDLPNGVWTDYGPTGKTSETGLRIGLNNEGPWKTFWATGEAWRDVQFEKGQDQDEAAKACARMNGNWNADGEKRTLGCLVCRARAGDVIEQVAMGVWTYWHPSGGIEKQGELVEGSPTGAWKFFHDNGEVMMRGHFDGGVETGPWQGAYRTGQARFEGAYVAGKPDGVWTSWLADGGVMSVGRYVQGQKVGEWKYAKGATLISVDAGVPEKQP